ncbi:40S ribosomal protein S2 isoform X2 [Crotalus tigris]|uniref:40S ribosomal protein S2 isoform X2 n=1 Tax=Crotalus tigris TaxID=88082 RepID=UPI00192F458C|nr:40S ribosomal protein S2 isoform X2 [Crotalus tigris]
MTPVLREGQEQEEQLPGEASEEALAVEAGAVEEVGAVVGAVVAELEAKLKTKKDASLAEEQNHFFACFEVKPSEAAVPQPLVRHSPPLTMEEHEWMPVTKLGRLVKDMKIKSLEEIYLFSLPIKAFVAIGDYNGHVGLGVKCSKEVATAIRGAIILAKLSIVPVRRGYWGNKIGKPHTVPCKVTGRCGSVLVRLIPAPRGTGIVSAPVPKKLLMMAGIDDCYTSARGCTATLGNFAKATFDAISKTYSYLTPDLWKETVFTKSPYQEFTDHLAKTHTTRVSVQTTQAAAVATT